jgi:hypothetical protein
MDCDKDFGLVRVMGGCICIEEKHELRLWMALGRSFEFKMRRWIGHSRFWDNSTEYEVPLAYVFSK